MTKNYSRKIRKTLNFILNEIINIIRFKYPIINEGALTLSSYDSLIYSLKLWQTKEDHSLLCSMYPNLESDTEYTYESIFRRINILSSSMIAQLYTDLYKKLIYKFEFAEYGISLCERDMLEEITQISEYNQLLRKFDNLQISREAIKALFEFQDLSAFDKILHIKCLNDRDCSKITRINPLFESEKQIYDLTVDSDFILRQLDKWEKSFENGRQKCYEELPDFLFNLYKIRKEETEKAITEIINYCNENDSINLETYDIDNKDDETISIQNYKVSKTMLKELINKFDDLYKSEKGLSYKK